MSQPDPCRLCGTDPSLGTLFVECERGSLLIECDTCFLTGSSDALVWRGPFVLEVGHPVRSASSVLPVGRVVSWLQLRSGATTIHQP
jgi:hypothetical protein